MSSKSLVYEMNELIAKVIVLINEMFEQLHPLDDISGNV